MVSGRRSARNFGFSGLVSEVIPAEAGIQENTLDPVFQRGDDMSPFRQSGKNSNYPSTGISIDFASARR